jgi:hypothetical protein
VRRPAVSVPRGAVAQSIGLLLGIVVLGQLASGDAYWVGLITTGTILYILAASLNMVFGYAGLFALGQQGLYAIGAYASVVVGIHLASLPWIVDVVAGVSAAGLMGFLDDRLWGRRPGRPDRVDQRHRGSGWSPERAVRQPVRSLRVARLAGVPMDCGGRSRIDVPGECLDDQLAART